MSRTDTNSRQVEPAGAKKWTISDDGLIYTFKLQDNTWSDGQPATAADYEYGMKRSLDPATASTQADEIYMIATAKEYNQGEGDRDKVAIKIITMLRVFN